MVNDISRSLQTVSAAPWATNMTVNTLYKSPQPVMNLKAGFCA